MILSIVGCARCDGDGHDLLEFHEFSRPAGNDGEYSHWAICPVTLEPILLVITDEA